MVKIPSDNSMIEVQLAHEKSEWAYAVYVMGPNGCLYSNRYEYDADKPGDQGRARRDARHRYDRTQYEYPGCNVYDES